ncbi:MAG: DUF2283 domain-containing protein [Candidatus Pacearchaeota archaeon]|jgi:uncharacterized protein YuzE
MEIDRKLNEVGEFDYDYKNDILFFKVKNREYSYSIELSNYVMDIDSEGLVVGLQIFDASNLFQTNKESLKNVTNWRLETSIKDKVIQVKIKFDMVLRNKIIEKNPILVERTMEDLPDSIVCVNC